MGWGTHGAMGERFPVPGTKVPAWFGLGLGLGFVFLFGLALMAFTHELGRSWGHGGTKVPTGYGGWPLPCSL